MQKTPVPEHPGTRGRFDPTEQGQVRTDMPDQSIAELVKQRSMLVILIAACTTARTAFEAADNAVDSQLVADLSKMIERSEAELEKLAKKISGSGS
jgi:hypothetical protein